MSDNQLTLKPINDLLGESFFIPAYQRGYRWTARQVTELLDDLLEFYHKEKRTGEFYCLQPIVVRLEKDQKRWELVDGQQRITTLFILSLIHI